MKTVRSAILKLRQTSCAVELGLCLSMELDDFSRDVLTRMQPNVYHVNGSIRGKLAITEAEVDELKADYDAIKARIDGGFKGFVLPGVTQFPANYICVAASKEGRSRIGCGRAFR